MGGRGRKIKEFKVILGYSELKTSLGYMRDSSSQNKNENKKTLDIKYTLLLGAGCENFLLP